MSWVECRQCCQWYHCDCVGYKSGQFVCDLLTKKQNITLLLQQNWHTALHAPLWTYGPKNLQFHICWQSTLFISAIYPSVRSKRTHFVVRNLPVDSPKVRRSSCRGICRETKDVFLAVCPHCPENRRDADTLLDIIERHVHKDSTVISL